MLEFLNLIGLCNTTCGLFDSVGSFSFTCFGFFFHPFYCFWSYSGHLSFYLYLIVKKMWFFHMWEYICCLLFCFLV